MLAAIFFALRFCLPVYAFLLPFFAAMWPLMPSSAECRAMRMCGSHRSAVKIRTGQAPPKLHHDDFVHRFRARFVDDAFRPEDEAIDRLAAIAWDAYCEG